MKVPALLPMNFAQLDWLNTHYPSWKIQRKLTYSPQPGYQIIRAYLDLPEKIATMYLLTHA